MNLLTDQCREQREGKLGASLYLDTRQGVHCNPKSFFKQEKKIGWWESVQVGEASTGTGRGLWAHPSPGGPELPREPAAPGPPQRARGTGRGGERKGGREAASELAQGWASLGESPRRQLLLLCRAGGLFTLLLSREGSKFMCGTRRRR